MTATTVDRYAIGGYDITFLNVEPFAYPHMREAPRPRALSMDEYGEVISDEELEAVEASWSAPPEPEPDVHEYGSFIVNVCQGLSQNKAAEALAAEFGGNKAKFRQMFQRGKLPVRKDGTVWSFMEEYRWLEYEV